jgi:hypothetical protein
VAYQVSFPVVIRSCSSSLDTDPKKVTLAPSNPRQPTLASCLKKALGQNGNGKALLLDAIGDASLLLPASQPAVALLQTAVASAGAFNAYDQALTVKNAAAGTLSLGGAVVSNITPAANFLSKEAAF